jgi:hemolysin activation/secretion protein
VVTVQVVEGFVSSVSVKGDSARLNRFLAQYGARIQASKPLKVQELERYALLANDLPGVSMQSVLTPSKNIPSVLMKLHLVAVFIHC